MSLLKYFKRKRKRDEKCDDREGNENVLSHEKTDTLTVNLVKEPGIGTEFKNDCKKIKVDRYPKDKNGRSFQNDWLSKFKWLEYSEELDKVFCCACKTFQPTGTKELTYISTGFNCWKKALDKNKGFPAHELSKNHLTAISMCEERKIREQKNQSISTLVNDKILEENRYYISSLVEMIQFLSVHELPFRGTFDMENNCENGLFSSFYDYTIKKDSKLADIVKRIPRNASYLSPKIQNDMIEIMVDLVRKDIAKNVLTADVPWYTLFMDGTRNKKMQEIVAFGIRYIQKGKIMQQTLSVEVAKSCDAKALTELALNVLEKCKLDTKYLLSQCYDGASVMSGGKGGVQALLQNKLGRKIPYVHCYNHRLHLVVMKVATNDEIQKFFGQCVALYNFFKKSNVRSIYEGKSLVRLLEQRWSGHYEIIMIIYENFEEIVEALKLIKVRAQKKFDAEDAALSIGLLHSLTNETFCFCLALMKKVLGILQPADKILQSHDVSLKKSSEIINSVQQILNSLRNDSSFESSLEESNILFKKLENEGRIKRIRKKNTLLENSIVYDYINEPNEEVNYSQKLKSVYYETIDAILRELESRFSNNLELIEAITSAEILNADTESYAVLKELGIDIPQKEEIIVAKNYLEINSDPQIDFFSKLYDMKVAFPNVYNLIATCRVFACSTAICESTFSALSRIDRFQRQCMTDQRQANLVLLSFEKNVTKNINVREFLKTFNSLADRKLQLF